MDKFGQSDLEKQTNDSLILQCSMAEWPSTEEHLFKFHSLNAERIFYSSHLKVNKLFRQLIVG